METENINREELIQEIFTLMGIETNLSSFTDDDLISTRDDLIANKENLREDINEWFDDELFDKLS
ncbi:MAG: hypothetical protein HOF69_06830 [Campylobacteraceae bacterium]|jgi:hypothetical protein|nr:hypothetical protein [Campylobacteraceae bacterium]MBT3882955.1 hypothetical protein [Campylobacteraceae bacterium]MBT4179215.1 hypothetical protein [Campylobacteraceae bacterium]MBT4707460.1 hypothetical protein [Campylobacteraceae bacterium]MBT5324074.1 hypothetical protein [Campylobacteraceae bacterium]